MSDLATLARPILRDAAAAAIDCTPVRALSRLEWQVVQLALREADAGGAEPVPPRGRLGRWLAALRRVLTGVEPAAGLADPRLEAVRRFIWALRRGRADVSERAEALVAFGFTPEQVCGMAVAGR